MELYAYVCGHPNNNLVKHNAFAGFICEIPASESAGSSERTTARRKKPATTKFKLEGITESLSRFTGNYNHKFRVSTEYQRSDRDKNKNAKKKKKKDNQRAPSSPEFVKPTGRFGGMILGRRIHTEVQLVARLLQTVPTIQPVPDEKKDRPGFVDLSYLSDKEEEEDDVIDMTARMEQISEQEKRQEERDTGFQKRREAQLEQTFRLASQLKSQNGTQISISPYTRSMVRSMVNIWNWKLMEAEWVVGDVTTAPSLRIGRHATPIDFVAINLNTNNLILGETKSSYNHGSFYREQGRMTRHFSCFDNSPATQAKIQLVMGAIMFTRQFGLDVKILYDGLIELWVVHLPTVEGETVKAKQIDKRFIMQAERALVAERLLQKHP